MGLKLADFTGPLLIYPKIFAMKDLEWFLKLIWWKLFNLRDASVVGIKIPKILQPPPFNPYNESVNTSVPPG